eukprot:9500688-Pyramimonas_sp.AAC.1
MLGKPGQTITMGNCTVCWKRQTNPVRLLKFTKLRCEMQFLPHRKSHLVMNPPERRGYKEVLGG